MESQVKFWLVDSVSGLRCLTVKAMDSQSKGCELKSSCGQEEFFIL